jgi:hypothetical protein
VISAIFNLLRAAFAANALFLPFYHCARRSVKRMPAISGIGDV